MLCHLIPSLLKTSFFTSKFDAGPDTNECIIAKNCWLIYAKNCWLIYAQVPTTINNFQNAGQILAEVRKIDLFVIEEGPRTSFDNARAHLKTELTEIAADSSWKQLSR